MREEVSTGGPVQKLGGSTLCSCDFSDGELCHMIWIVCTFCLSLTYFRHLVSAADLWGNPVSHALLCFSWALSWVFWHREASDGWWYSFPCKGSQQHLLGLVKLEQANGCGFPNKASWMLSSLILWFFTLGKVGQEDIQPSGSGELKKSTSKPISAFCLICQEHVENWVS